MVPEKWPSGMLPISLIAFVAVAAISVVFERVLYARLYKAPELDQVLLTIGLVFVSVAAVTFVWGPNPISMPMPPLLTGNIELGFKSIPLYRAFMIVSGAIIVASLYYGLERTRIGAQIRAAVDNRRMAESCGVNTDRLFTYTFALGSGLAADRGGQAAHGRDRRGHRSRVRQQREGSRADARGRHE